MGTGEVGLELEGGVAQGRGPIKHIQHKGLDMSLTGPTVHLVVKVAKEKLASPFFLHDPMLTLVKTNTSRLHKCGDPVVNSHYSPLTIKAKVTVSRNVSIFSHVSNKVDQSFSLSVTYSWREKFAE